MCEKDVRNILYDWLIKPREIFMKSKIDLMSHKNPSTLATLPTYDTLTCIIYREWLLDQFNNAAH